MNCHDCGFPLDSDSHIFNVNCAASNLSYENLVAEVRHAEQDYKDTFPEGEVLDKLVDVAIDALALARFQSLVASQPGQRRTLIDELLNWRKD